MVVTVTEVKLSWQSPDKLVSIWDFKTSDGNEFRTKSKAIAQSQGQMIDISPKVQNGRTYFVMTPKDTGLAIDGPVAAPQAPQVPSALQQPRRDPDSARRFSEAVDRFDSLIRRLELLLAPEDMITIPADEPKEDIDLPPTDLYDDQMGKDVTE